MASQDGPTADAAPAAPAAAPAATPAADSASTPDGVRGGARNSANRGGRGGDRGRGNKRKHGGFGSQKHDMTDRREQVRSNRAEKRRRVIEGEAGGESYMSINFSAEEIAAEERRPKRKVAVLIGYAGTGYSGLQMNHREKTVEGDIFAALVAAGAISKANADDPRKSSLVRCARTDKGVHAAGNVLSLKLIVEDPDVVARINQHLPPQIRVWDIQRTNNGFSCYQGCDSRWYEYLMPSYALLPPRPDSFLWQQIDRSARDKGVLDKYAARLSDVQGFWEEVEETAIKPVLDRLSPEVRERALEIVRGIRPQGEDGGDGEGGCEERGDKKEGKDKVEKQEDAPIAEDPLQEVEGEKKDEKTEADATTRPPRPLTPVEAAVKEIKAAYVAAKRRYRATPVRLQKLQEALDLYMGTNNFHNYTILKSVSDPSARRHIKSFVVDPTPIPIGDTEWLSIKVHGQSFMMHQIRKMIAMAVMLVRCGAPLDVIPQSYGPRRISIPKAPGLGLMLERPMFVEYNKRASSQFGRETIEFSKYENEIREFKDREIYRRMFETEERENAFHTFFHQLDNFRTDYFLWVTAGGFEAAYERTDRGGDKIPKALEAELGDEADGVQEVAN